MSASDKAPAADGAPGTSGCAPKVDACTAAGEAAGEDEFERYLALARGRPRERFGLRFIASVEAHWSARGAKAFDALLKRHPRDYVRIMAALVPTAAMERAVEPAQESPIEVIYQGASQAVEPAEAMRAEPNEGAAQASEREPDAGEAADLAAASEPSCASPLRTGLGRWRPGCSGNPHGRPRTRFGARFVAAAERHWLRHGGGALDRLLDEHPRDYLRILAALVPPDAMAAAAPLVGPIQVMFLPAQLPVAAPADAAA